ncbi:MAG: ABC-F family ATP-binding cassette domain-containing protein [Treponemataceae bacterium]|nr:ABC-F family ATP-binding cassette domain-containing protein [Treponemataceae bacterium]
MAFIQFSKISLAFGDRDILKDVSVNLKTGTKAALTGANGAGKSTLIKIMAGLVEPDSGKRTAQSGARIAYLPQSGLTHRGRTLKEEADLAFDYGYKIQNQIEEIGEKLKQIPSENVSAQNALLEQHSALMETLENSGWYRRESLAESVLLGLGFSRDDFEKMTDAFSGGWQMRIALAKALMQQPDILLLDEPTNYLDIEARAWLEDFLQKYSGAFLLVSHDRYFLDVTINEVYELFNGELKCYPGNFSHYEKVRELELQTLIAAYKKQQEEIEHLQSFVDRFRYKATKAVQAQERQKQLDKIVRIEIPESLKKIHFKFLAAPHSGRLVLQLDSVTKSYDGKTDVLSNLDLTIENGERVVAVGKNGAGKSTLLRIISEQDKNFSGTMTLGTGVQIGYFSQDSAETICGAETVLQYIENSCPLELVPKARDMLGAFLFRGDDVFKSLDVLSGGEKSRISLLKLLLRPVNFLVLDEPTNHLDMHSKDVLLDALKDFGGTVIFVSHDHAFIQNLATRVIELSPGHCRNFVGDYEYYLGRIEDEKNGTVGHFSFGTDSKFAEKKSGKIPVSNSAANEGTKQKSAGAIKWEEEKRLASERRKIERQVEKLETQIAAKENEKKSLEEKLAEPEIYSNGEKAKEVQRKITALAEELESLNAEWESAAEMLG